MKIAFDENLPMAMVRVFETFATEKQLRKLTGNFEIESAKKYTPAPDDSDFLRRSDVPWIERFAKADGRIIISGNTDIINVPHERLALINAGMITIFFEAKWNQRGFFEKCAHLMLWWPIIARKVKRAKRGSFWKVPNDWTASDRGKLRPISNRDPHELKLERRAKALAKQRAAKKRSTKRPPVTDLFKTEEPSDV